MRKLMALTLSAALLAGCAEPPPVRDTSTLPVKEKSQASNGSTFLSIISTPLYMAFKIPVCVATLAVSVPAASVSALSDQPASNQEFRRDLGEGVAANCGPPYAPTP